MRLKRHWCFAQCRLQQLYVCANTVDSCGHGHQGSQVNQRCGGDCLRRSTPPTYSLGLPPSNASTLNALEVLLAPCKTQFVIHMTPSVCKLRGMICLACSGLAGYAFTHQKHMFGVGHLQEHRSTFSSRRPRHSHIQGVDPAGVLHLPCKGFQVTTLSQI